MKKFLTTIAICLLCTLGFTSVSIASRFDVSCSYEASNKKVVYITPTGKCYHYKKSCAGKNAIETTLDKCNGKRPCKKCVR